ncbi:DUF4145 domain-containing protein [Oceanimonas baumannii]|uniref:Uncharacterized protein DUF4145 n=1 Tax=Oceanimonas baumannii TaxID=129578 RepID=A0A235CJX3_9GAMM|nr:DUF4145 domain-containing protein [Oceanimonas baumannii]OYD24888.1 hypothetical protein B6S09_06680 [Oceanimonas baumannii]TDW59649.1 uncharacterized protein DUF4145 [Oceanimonas baumannii]
MNQDSKGIPSTSKTAFNCPHCGAYTTQQWSSLYAKKYINGRRVPVVSNANRKLVSALGCDVEHLNLHMQNLSVAECFNCHGISVWVQNQIVHPPSKVDIQPNQDLPPYIINLFEEAREIVDASPKGAAALLRLSIQYLCAELGGTGKNIDKDIASLVSKGLNPMIQQALDVVRVIGNEAVHPGEIDLNDNQDIALQLFSLINLIAEQMITHPKHVEAIYSSLPEGKLRGIEQRNKKATESNGGT